MNNNILITVLMSMYKPDYHELIETIDSVKNQTFKEFEFLIIQDDNSEEVNDISDKISTFDERIKVVRNSSNLGLIESLNKGMTLANGKYIARIDVGDLWLEEKLSKQVGILEKNNEIIICGTFATIIDKNGEFIRNSQLSISNDEIINNINSCVNPFFHPSVMFRRNEKLQYNSNALYCEDYEMWIKCSYLGKMYNIPEYLLKYRIDFQSITNSKRYLAFWNISHIFFKYKENKNNNLDPIETQIQINSKSKMNIFQKYSSLLYSKGLYLSYYNNNFFSLLCKFLSILVSPDILYIYLKRMLIIKK